MTYSDSLHKSLKFTNIYQNVSALCNIYIHTHMNQYNNGYLCIYTSYIKCLLIYMYTYKVCVYTYFIHTHAHKHTHINANQ